MFHTTSANSCFDLPDAIRIIRPELRRFQSIRRSTHQSKERFAGGSIEGDAFLTSSPICSCTHPSRGAAGQSDSAGGLRSHELMRSVAAPHCAFKQSDGNCQPWFYLRLVTYGFVGLSRGHTAGVKLRILKAWLIPTVDTRPRISLLPNLRGNSSDLAC